MCTYVETPGRSFIFELERIFLRLPALSSQGKWHLVTPLLPADNAHHDARKVAQFAHLITQRFCVFCLRCFILLIRRVNSVIFMRAHSTGSIELNG